MKDGPYSYHKEHAQVNKKEEAIKILTKEWAKYASEDFKHNPLNGENFKGERNTELGFLFGIIPLVFGD